MVTAMHDAHHRAAGVRVGANGYLTKPFTPAQLYETMDAALAWNEEHNKRGTTGEINFDVRSELTYLSEASDMLADLFAHTPLTDRHIKDLKQAIMEMGGNAIEWGHRKNADLVLRITYRIDPSSVTLIITDQGPGFNPRNLPHAASDEDPIGHIEIRNELGLREGGFGIMLARGLVDEFRYNKSRQRGDAGQALRSDAKAAERDARRAGPLNSAGHLLALERSVLTAPGLERASLRRNSSSNGGSTWSPFGSMIGVDCVLGSRPLLERDVPCRFPWPS